MPMLLELELKKKLLTKLVNACIKKIRAKTCLMLNVALAQLGVLQDFQLLLDHQVVTVARRALVSL